MKTFKGRVILGGNLEGEALVTHQGFNTLAAYVQGLITKSPICHDQNNPDLYQKHIAGKVLCLPVTIGSTTGGMVLQCAAAEGIAPAAMLYADHIDTVSAPGIILADIWNAPRSSPSTNSAATSSTPCRMAKKSTSPPTAPSRCTTTEWRSCGTPTRPNTTGSSRSATSDGTTATTARLIGSTLLIVNFRKIPPPPRSTPTPTEPRPTSRLLQLTAEHVELRHEVARSRIAIPVPGARIAAAYTKRVFPECTVMPIDEDFASRSEDLDGGTTGDRGTKVGGSRAGSNERHSTEAA
jgi:predicted aconitase with swiveling domain